MHWHFSTDLPIYLQVIDQMKAAILSGEYAPGARLPSIRDLSVEAGINPNTLQRALGALEDEGLIQTFRTTGKTITEDTGQIALLRRRTCEKTVTECLERLRTLGLSEEEIQECFTAALQKERTEHE